MEKWLTSHWKCFDHEYNEGIILFGRLLNSIELCQRNSFSSMRYIIYFSIVNLMTWSIYSSLSFVNFLFLTYIPLQLYISYSLVHMLLDLTIRLNCLVLSCTLNPLLQVWWRLRFDTGRLRVWTLVDTVLLIWSKLFVDFSPTGNHLTCIFDMIWRRKLFSSINRNKFSKFWNHWIWNSLHCMKLKFIWNTFSYVFIGVSVYDWICDGTTHSN